jgi:hypothetical protein
MKIKTSLVLFAGLGLMVAVFPVLAHHSLTVR